MATSYELLRKEGVLIGGHFKLRSGNHANEYIHKQRIFDDVFWFHTIAQELAEYATKHQAHIIAGPETGGAKLARAVAENMTYAVGISLYKGEGDYEFSLRDEDAKRVRGKGVAVVDDVVTTGGSLRGSIAAIERAGGSVLCALAMVRRSMRPIELEKELYACHTVDLAEFESDDCPWCDRGIAISPKPI